MLLFAYSAFEMYSTLFGWLVQYFVISVEIISISCDIFSKKNF